MAENIPERLVWAVEKLQLSGGETILEIGCGRGVAVALVCALLRGGTITAIDRSATAIEAALKRNREHVAAGRAVFREASIEEFEEEAGKFDIVFAVNVNLSGSMPLRGWPQFGGCLRKKAGCSCSTNRPRPARRPG